jgi:hypothetical protein
MSGYCASADVSKSLASVTPRRPQKRQHVLILRRAQHGFRCATFIRQAAFGMAWAKPSVTVLQAFKHDGRRATVLGFPKAYIAQLGGYP